MKTVIADIDNGIATLTMNRPEVLNSMNAVMARELRLAAEKLATDDAVRCVVLCGAGEHFMAGGDIGFFKQQMAKGVAGERLLSKEVFADAHGFIRALNKLPQPVIASVQGMVVGFGISLMSACDLVVAADNSQFSLGYSQLGVSPDGGSTYFLPRTIGIKRTMELLLLGDRYDAPQFLAMGMLNRVVSGSELEAETLKLARRLAAGPAHAYANSKQLVNASLNSTLEEQLDAEEEKFIDCTTTTDFAEGVNAFCEKRRPNFGG
jgi:2-(1,2-epoxy-1,2-dihydrophenyl)acetyl-CoA isomerase